MKALIFAQLAGIRQSKKLFLTFVSAPLLLLFCSYHATNSWMSPEYVLAMFAILNAMLSSEIMHWLTIDEIKDGLFDIILLSPLTKGEILLGKLCIPFIGGLAFSFGPLVINNVLSKWFPFVPWQFTIGTSMLLLFSCIAACLVEFIVLMILRRKNTNIHFFVIAIGMLFSLWMYYLLKNSLYWFAFLTISIPLFLILLAIQCLKEKSQIMSSKNRVFFQALYSKPPTTPLGGMIRNNLSVLRLYRYSVLHLCLATISPIVIAFFCSRTPEVPSEILIAIVMTSITASVNTYLVYYALLYENRQGIGSVLRVVGYTDRFRFLEKTLSAGTLSSLLSVVSFCGIAIVQGKLHGTIAVLTVVNCFLSAICASVCLLKVNTFKSENIAKVMISVISILLQIGMLFLLQS